MYRRVIPRDLFNEAKLLKCLGQLSLLVHEGKDIRWPMTVELDDSCDEEFLIDQNENDGGIFCVNVGLKVRGRHVHLQTGLNSRQAYPLVFYYGADEGMVFTEDGRFSPEFEAFLDSFEGG